MKLQSRLSIAAALVAALLLFAHPLSAQQTGLPNAPDARWENAQKLSFGTPIIVHSDSSHVTCKFNNAAADTLSCIHHGGVDFQRNNIRKVETYNRGASAILLAALGAGFGIMMVEVGNCAIGGRGDSVKGAVYAGGAGMGAIIFYPIGYFTHPIHHTVYEAQ